jgi:predicted nucleotidyltransferase component of viral defense system
MEPTNAKALSSQLQISLDYVVREFYEVALLKELFESKFASQFVFKGGTALRLAYQSPRFSEDLDFDVLGAVDHDEFFTFLTTASKHYPSITTVEPNNKFHTLFALIRISDPVLGRAFSIKFEASKRDAFNTSHKPFTDKIITSPTNPLSVLARVSTLDQILLEKEDALKNRKVARDLFDYWYINQLRGVDIMPDLAGFDPQDAHSELRRLLPRPYWRAIDVWFE